MAFLYFLIVIFYFVPNKYCNGYLFYFHSLPCGLKGEKAIGGGVWSFDPSRAGPANKIVSKN